MLFFKFFILSFVATADLLDLRDSFEFLLNVYSLGVQFLLQTISFCGYLPQVVLQVLHLALSCADGSLAPV